MTKLSKQLVVVLQDAIRENQQVETVAFFDETGAPVSIGVDGADGADGVDGVNGVDGDPGSGVIATNAARIPLTGLQAWLDASDRSSILQASGQVIKISDRSGNGFDFEATSDGPSIISETLNGRDVLDFDGTQALDSVLPNARAKFLHSGPTTIFMVARRTGTDGIVPTFLGNIPYSGPSDVGAALISISNYLGLSGVVISVVNGDGVANVIEAGTTFPINTWELVSIKLDPANGTAANRAAFWKDGVLDSAHPNSSTQSPETVDSPANSLRLGAGAGGYDTFLRGSIAELIIYNRALTTQERIQVESYIRRKWFGDPMLAYVAPASITTTQLGQALIDLGLMKSS